MPTLSGMHDNLVAVWGKRNAHMLPAQTNTHVDVRAGRAQENGNAE